MKEDSIHQRNTLRQALGLKLALAWLGLMVWATPAAAQTLYWDRNGSTAGAGTAPSGTWSTGTAAWTTNSAGTSGTIVNWTNGRDAVFSAGTNATSAYDVTISGTVNVGSITVEEGRPIFNGGTINFSDATPNVTVNAGAILTWGLTGLTSSTNTVNIGGAGTVNLTLTGSFGGTINLSGGTLRLTNSVLGVGTLNITGNTTIDFAGASSTLSVNNFSVSAGATLTIQNWAGTTDFFYAANWAGATYNTMGSAPMNRVVFAGSTANQTGWDSYDNQIRPNVPEPSTYGALLLAGLVGWFGYRRFRRKPAVRACGGNLAPKACVFPAGDTPRSSDQV